MLRLNTAIVGLPYAYSFARALEFILSHETEFIRGHQDDYNFVATEHDPRDPGSTTRYGLDIRSHPHLDIDSLTLAQAAQVYYQEIWMTLRCKDLISQINIVLADTAVNTGNARAVRWLQEIVGTKQDGAIGPVTIGAANSQSQATLIHKYLDRRQYYYSHEVRPALQAIYLKGWTNRVNDLRQFVS